MAFPGGWPGRMANPSMTPDMAFKTPIRRADRKAESRCGRLARPAQKGMTLIEIMVTVVITTIVGLFIYAFVRNWLGQMERQKTVERVQTSVREATRSIDKYLVSSGVGGDSLFYDPHRLLSAPLVDGGHRVFEISRDSLILTAYGNYTGMVANLSEPMVDKSARAFKVDKPAALRGHAYVYVTAGSAQEVARVTRIDNDGTVRLSHDTFVPYPKGTLVFALERVKVSVKDRNQLLVSRESAEGKAGFVRDFTPVGRVVAGDTVNFKVTDLNRMGGRIHYALRFATKTKGRSPLVLERKAEQTVLVRGY